MPPSLTVLLNTTVQMLKICTTIRFIHIIAWREKSIFCSKGFRGQMICFAIFFRNPIDSGRYRIYFKWQISENHQNLKFLELKPYIFFKFHLRFYRISFYLNFHWDSYLRLRYKYFGHDISPTSYLVFSIFHFTRDIFNGGYSSIVIALHNDYKL